MKTLKLQSLVASFFSIIFSLSIAKQLVNVVNTSILILLFIFTILFLLYNENRKVKELRRMYMKRKYSLVTIIFTLFISILMSSVGIYFWTNKYLQETAKNDEKLQKEITVVESDYNNQINKLNNQSINTEEYHQLEKDILWWKNRRPANLSERSERNNQISLLQERRNDLLNQHSIQKERQLQLLLDEKQQKLEEVNAVNNTKVSKLTIENYVSFIFIILVLITEFIIINIQHEIGRYYVETDSKEIKIIEDLLNQGLSEITIDDIVYSKFGGLNDTNKREIYKKSKKLFNLLLTLGVLTGKGFYEPDLDGNRVMYASFIKSDQAISKLRDYYFKLNNLKK